MDYDFQRHRVDRISREKIISELEATAKIFDFREFTCKEFSSTASIKHQTVLREFGDWSKAMSFLRSHLSGKNLILQPRLNPKRIDYISDKEIFAEMEKVWNAIGHRPSKIEWDSADARFNYNTVRRHFDGWTNACLKFIEYKMGGVILSDDVSVAKENSLPKSSELKIKEPEERREIPLKLRLKVLQRDNFRCVLCGKSPATNPGTILHIDHVLPFSKGGKTTAENLRTLCAECNWGKGNDGNF